MRARFEKIPSDPSRSFHVQELRVPRFDAPWHFHPEIELTLIRESRGRRFVGDSIEPFAAGDLALLGPNLPHFWHNEPRRGAGEMSRAVVVQFDSDFLGTEALSKPEFLRVAGLFKKSARGLHFSGTVASEAAARLIRLSRLNGLAALLELLAILDLLARSAAGRALATAAYAPSLDRRSEERLARVYAFLMRNFREPLTLAQIARVGAMAPEAFSRYFKRVTGRNVFVFVSELRIDHAGQLLRETNDRIGDIAGAAGFQTLSSFNRGFRARMNCRPSQYRKAYRPDGTSEGFVS